MGSLTEKLAEQFPLSDLKTHILRQNDGSRDMRFIVHEIKRGQTPRNAPLTLPQVNEITLLCRARHGPGESRQSERMTLPLS